MTCNSYLPYDIIIIRRGCCNNEVHCQPFRRPASVLDDLAQQWKIGRSGVVARLLEEAKTIQLRESLVEGYKAMADESAETAEQTLAAQAEVILK